MKVQVAWKRPPRPSPAYRRPGPTPPLPPSGAPTGAPIGPPTEPTDESGGVSQGRSEEIQTDPDGSGEIYADTSDGIPAVSLDGMEEADVPASTLMEEGFMAESSDMSKEQRCHGVESVAGPPDSTEASRRPPGGLPPTPPVDFRGCAEGHARGERLHTLGKVVAALQAALSARWLSRYPQGGPSPRPSAVSSTPPPPPTLRLEHAVPLINGSGASLLLEVQVDDDNVIQNPISPARDTAETLQMVALEVEEAEKMARNVRTEARRCDFVCGLVIMGGGSRGVINTNELNE